MTSDRNILTKRVCYGFLNGFLLKILILFKALWLPGSACKLAIITADYARIYDMEVSISEPLYHFMLAAGKISDATFCCFGKWRFVKKYFGVFGPSFFTYISHCLDLGTGQVSVARNSRGA